MLTLIGAVFVASLLGSMHCAGMCGAFLAFAVVSDDGRTPSRATLNAAYNLGRLVTYAILGAICGALGAAIDTGGAMIGVQRTAAIIAGAMMITFGVIAVLRSSGVAIPKLPLPAGLQSMLTIAHRRAFDLPPTMRAAMIGLLTTLLPCGWLYAFAITAAGTAHPLNGALTMAVFWLGTLPVMIGLGAGLQRLTGSLRQRLPLVTSMLIVVVGLYTVAGRVHAPVLRANETSVAPVSLDESIGRVESLDSEAMPCCRAR